MEQNRTALPSARVIQLPLLSPARASDLAALETKGVVYTKRWVVVLAILLLFATLGCLEAGCGVRRRSGHERYCLQSIDDENNRNVGHIRYTGNNACINGSVVYSCVCRGPIWLTRCAVACCRCAGNAFHH